MANRNFSPNFRKDETGFVMNRWSAHLSCSLVGVGSIGKSNLLQHITDMGVQRRYRGANAELYIPIVIDGNALGPIAEDASEPFRCWAGYELLMHRVYMSLFPFDMLSPEEAQRFYELYQQLQDGSNPLYSYMGLRYFELGLSIFIRHGVRFVFLLDEFEELLRQLPIKFFQTLRGVRDSNKRALLYLTFSRAPLSVLVDRFGIDPLTIEPFTELFTDSVYYVGPYSETDAQAMMEELASRYSKPLPIQVNAAIQNTTGRYAGLMRAAFSIIDTIPENAWRESADQLAAVLLSRYGIQLECRTIWTSLTPSEHYVLKAVARLVPFQANEESELTVSMLVQKKLLHLDKSQQRLQIEPPIFRAFVASNPD